MKKMIGWLAALVVCAMWPAAYAEFSVGDVGDWPKSWPAELEVLRKQSRTLEGPRLPERMYEIPFTKREEFEAAWPALLKVKSKGAAVVLVRGPYTFLGANIKAGVVIHCPPEPTDRRSHPEAAIKSTDVHERWMWTTYIELVVDGDIVDLNRLRLPANSEIVDQRFKEREKAATRPSE